MKLSATKILEAASIHAAQKAIELGIEQVKGRFKAVGELKKRVDVLEKDVAALKGAKSA